MRQTVLVTTFSADPVDTAELRKARGAFFTPEKVTQFVSQWAILHRTLLAVPAPLVLTKSYQGTLTPYWSHHL